MMKTLAILTVTLFVFPVQTYGQTQDAKKAPKQANPSTPIPTTSPQQADAHDLQTENSAHIDADVRVVSTPQKDGYDRAAVGINLTLALIGIGTLFYIAKQVKVSRETLAEIKAQAVHMASQVQEMQAQTAAAQTSADAARKSAEALISAERAWVLASVLKTDSPFPFKSLVQFPSMAKCELIFKNYGATPAVIESFCCKTEWTIPAPEFPVPPDYGDKRVARIILAPQEEKSIGTFFPVEQFPGFRLECAIFKGYVNYGGIFEGQRTTNFCFGFDEESGSFFPIGPAPYNNAT